MIEKILLNKIFILLFFSFISIISFGVDISAHHIYNLSQLIILENDLSQDVGANLYDRSHFNPMYYYIRFIVPILEYGIIFVISSLVIKFFAFWLVFKIASHFLESDLAIIVSIIFLMAYLRASHGLIENGFWVAPVFFPAALSALTTLIGINSFIKEKFLISGISFAASIFFHSLYGITALAFLSLGFIFILMNNHKHNFFRNFLLGFIPIIISIIYIAYFRTYSTSDIELSHSINDWYNFIGGNVDFNISLLLTLSTTGYCLIPLVLTGLYLSIVEKKKTTLEILTIFSTFILFVFTCVEIIHRNEIFINFFSEFFVATQFRRGIWVPVFFSFIKIAKILYENKEQIFNSKQKILFLTYIPASYIFPSVFAILVVYGALFVYLRNSIGFILFLSSVLLAYIFYENGYFEVASQIKILLYSIVFSCTTVILMLLIKKFYKKPSKRFGMAVMFSIALLFSSRGLIQNKLNEDLSIILDGGIFSKTKITKINNYLGSVYYDLEADYCMQKNSINYKNQRIQLPITGIRNSRLSLFPFKQVHGYFNPMYSRKDFELTINGLQEVFGLQLVNTFFAENSSYNDEYFSEAYNNISIDQLLNLRNNSDLRFYIMNSERVDLEGLLICQSNRYFVYDLKLL